MLLFILQFIISSILSSVLLLGILFSKRMLQNKIGVKWHYYIDLFSIGVMLIPFIPRQLFQYGRLFRMHLGMKKLQDLAASGVKHYYDTGSNLSEGSNWMQDFSQSVSRTLPLNMIWIIFTIWVIGVIVFSIITVINNRGIKMLKRSIVTINDNEILSLFHSCINLIGIKKNIILGETPLISSPMVIGILKTYIILPSEVMKSLSVQETEYILQHELIHVKKKDILWNYVFCIFNILYWFNPCVCLFLKAIKSDREMACDAVVLEMLDRSCYVDYGKTIIHFIEAVQKVRYFAATQMGGSKKLIRRRIEGIAKYSEETKKTRRIGKAICLMIVTISIIQATVVSTLTYASEYNDFNPRQVVYEDMSEYFQGTDGSFVLYDLKKDRYTIYNREKSLTRVSPDSTYKIYSALIALETGIIQAEDTSQAWDQTRYPYPEWNQTQDLSQAMRYSVSWYFQRLDETVGVRQLKDYFDGMNYGNCDLSGGIDDYWMESSLLISPVEQVELLKKLYTGQLNFRPEHMNMVKNAIILSKEEGRTLFGKTGTGTVNGKDRSGWFIGYIETSKDTYIFAIYINDEDRASGSIAAKIAMSILKADNIY